MNFPDLVYRGIGPHQRKGGGWDFKQVSNDAELDAALVDNWHLSLVDAIVAHDNKAIKEAEKPLTRAELEILAKDAGIKFDGRMSDATLDKKVKEWATAKSNS